MSTHAIIAAEIGGAVEGRYVHLDGYPTGIGEALLRIVERDGLERAVKTLLLDHVDWSSVNDQTGSDHPWGIAVPGYGVATKNEDTWYPVSEGAPGGSAHWAYVLGPEGIDVYQSVNGRWRFYARWNWTEGSGDDRT